LNIEGVVGSSVLIVRHGEGRGRRETHKHETHKYMNHVLRHFRQERPDLYRRLVFHHTGSPAPRLTGVGGIVFWLREPLRLFPACYEEAVRIADEARQRAIPIVNPPESLFDVSKSNQGRRWREAGIPTPDVERFETLESLRNAVERLPFPLVLRGDERHRQNAMHVIRDGGELLKLDAKVLIFPYAVSPLIDVRLGYRDKPRSAYARLFHKKRLIVANGAIQTKHVMFSYQPIVGSSTSIYNKAGRGSFLEAAFLLWPLHRDCVAEDLAYWQQGTEHSALMLKACDALGLGFAAIDYSNLSDGTPVLWEANPLFGLPSLRNIRLPGRRRAVERISSYYEAIGRFLCELTMASAAGARHYTATSGQEVHAGELCDGFARNAQRI
jgi:hypothetical protein